MVKVTTKSGFTCDVNENSLRDWRFIHALRDMNQEDALIKMQGVYNMILLVLGEDGEKSLSEHVKDDSGFIDSLKMAAEVNEIVTILKETRTDIKNS
jgi:hypothetical protein